MHTPPPTTCECRFQNKNLDKTEPTIIRPTCTHTPFVGHTHHCCFVFQDPGAGVIRPSKNKNVLPVEYKELLLYRLPTITPP